MLIFFGRSQRNKSSSTIVNEIDQEKQITYAIEAHANIPIIIYINDIKASEFNTPLNSAIDMNPFILKNGKYKVKLEVYPSFRTGDVTISPEEINSIKLSFGSYFRNRKTDQIDNYTTSSAFKLTTPNTNVPYFEQEWEVEVDNLPYTIEGWSNGQDLSKIDQIELEKKVVLYYQKLWNLMNNGDSVPYRNLWTNADKELLVYDYLTENNYKKAIEENNLDIGKCKNMMIPLEDYEMKLYAHGKIVSLERKTNTLRFNNEDPLDIKGWSPLIRKYKVSGGASYGLKLYLPEGSNEFVIIRK